jgi:hypothetical protein
MVLLLGECTPLELARKFIRLTRSTMQCFLTIPGLIYLVGVPMWARAQKFAKAYAFAAVDALYTIMWLSAFAGLIAWNRAGVKQGTADLKIPFDQGNCTTFAFGEEDKCKLSYSAMSVGVIIL